MKVLLLIFALALAGCVTPRQDDMLQGTVRSGSFCGEGVYVRIYHAASIPLNATSKVALRVRVGNGYTNPIFMCMEPDLLFSLALDCNVVLLRVDGSEIDRGTIDISGFADRAHPLKYLYISGSQRRSGDTSWSCCDSAEVIYQASIDAYRPHASIDLEPQPIPEETAQIMLEIPLCVEYLVLGDNQIRNANLTVRAIIVRITDQGQQNGH